MLYITRRCIMMIRLKGFSRGNALNYVEALSSCLSDFYVQENFLLKPCLSGIKIRQCGDIVSFKLAKSREPIKKDYVTEYRIIRIFNRADNIICISLDFFCSELMLFTGEVRNVSGPRNLF